MGTENGTLTLSGVNTFSENTAAGTPNDIRSNSKVTVADGATDLQSGYLQETSAGSTPALEVKNDAKLSAITMTLDAGSVTVAENGILGHGTANMAELDAAIAEAQASGVDTSGGAYVGKASLDLAKAALTVGNATTQAGNESPVFGDGSALLVDQTALAGDAAFTGVNTATLVDTAQVHVQNAVAGQTLNLFDDDADATTASDTTVSVYDTNQDNTAEIQITSDDSMVTFGTITDGATAQDIADATTGRLGNVNNALPGVDGELGALFAGMYAAGLNDTDAAEGGRRFLSRLNNNRFLGGGEAATATIESAARIAAVAGVPQMTWAAQKAANAAVTQRTSLAAPASAGLQAVAADGSVQTGASAGDGLKNGFAMWIMPLYQSWNAWGMEGGNLDMDVNGNLGGLAVGADYTFAHAFRAGITVNMGGGYAEGSGDFNKTTNDFTFWGLGAYLGWSKDNFGLTADINHTWVYNDVEQDLAASMRMDTLKSDITSRALSAGLRGEYKLATDALDITPHVGVRYTYLTTDSYDVESGNANVLEGDAIHQGIWTFPIGVAFSKDVQMDSGWYVKPSLDVAVVPAAGDIKARGDVRFTGVPGSAEVSSQTMDYITYMGQAGLEFGNDNVKLGVNYNLQMGAQSTAHGVFGTLRYEF